MFMKIFLSGCKHNNDASLHMIFRELFKEAMCTVCEKINYSMCMKIFLSG